MIASLNKDPSQAPKQAGPKGRRPYDSALRREQAQATRARIATAARRLFSDRGWAGTRVRDVAREAGVAEPTVYAAYGSKAGLARALIEDVEATASLAEATDQLHSAAADPAGQLAILISFDRRLFERGGDVIAVLRDAGRSEPDLHAAYQEGRARADRIRQELFASWPPATLPAGTTAASATDTYAALCNIDVYRLLTEERGKTPDQIEQWWHDTLTRLLLQ